MSILVRIARGFAILRGFMLAVLTVPWLSKKVRGPDATEAERSLAWMVGCRTILLGVAILRADAVVPFEEGRRLAAQLPQARFVPLESKPWPSGVKERLLTRSV